ncbi:hypothetical protein EJ02DRAFT_449540 [Clathrospora elynae]|uniref:Coenzyme Q-binding protein COQ10 START domain-containing protein n=1 Tax=Clathrospora elynae TaxID=706981 RepID=A0A6A5T7G7_9PLEO|nr:hypothetical protein EJ02DRAFT_449540 [Clathrospora elynae]
MVISVFLHILLAISSHAPLVTSQVTNLPPTTPGVFSAGTRIEISSTAAAAYQALTDFPNYAAWNPFVRAAIVVSPLNHSLPEQYPIEGKNIFLRVQIPPLAFPVDKDTPDNPLATQFSYEKITAVQPELGRLAWKFQPDTPGVLQAERWQAVSDLGNGKVLYESREVFRGVGAVTLKATLGENLQKGFDAQGVGLKTLLESGSGT